MEIYFRTASGSPTSLDELPQLWDILTGRMSLIGPRPHLVRDMLFYTDDQLRRQSVMPGLTGWAQINGRNSIGWDKKLELDLYYVDHISFSLDVKIFFKTIAYVLKREGINENDAQETTEVETHENLGEMLLRTGRITKEHYDMMLIQVKIVVDILLFFVSFILASIICDGQFLSHGEWTASILNALLSMLLLAAFHYYHVKAESGSLEIVSRCLKAIVPAFAISAVVHLVRGDFHGLVFSFVYLSYFSVMSLGSRFSIRLLIQSRNAAKAKNGPRTIIYGAGDIGTMLARQYYAGKLEYELVGYVDDDPSLRRTDVLGIPVLGTVDDLPKLIEKNAVKMVIIGITNLSKENLYKAVDAAKDHEADVKIIPTLYEMQQGAKELDLRNLDYPDLLGRPLIKIDKTPIEAMVRDKVALVTGACGSIGSEICRQLVGFGVKRLVMIDIDESGLHDAGLRLTNFKEEINDSIIPVLCDIKNREKIERIFRQYRPDIVYHAAAYKHVPMGEREPDEIISTNVAGRCQEGRRDLHRQGSQSHQRHGCLQEDGRA